MTGLQLKKMLALSASTAAVAFAATPAWAQNQPQQSQAATEAELLKLVRAQSAKIDDLEARLAKVEADRSATASTTTAPVTTGAAPAPQVAQQSATDAEVQNAIADSQASGAQAEVAQVSATKQSGGDVRWRSGGPEFRSANGFFTFSPTGRALFDFSTTSGSKFDDRNLTGIESRDIRLGATGSIGKLGYKVDVGFANNTVALKEAYISYDTKLIGRSTEFYLGQKLEDRSIDGSTSEVHLPFMERNAVAEVAQPAIGFFAFGPQVKVIGSRWHASVAFSGNAIGDGSNINNSYAVLGRAHWNPIKGRDGFVHVGVWGFAENLSSTEDSINAHPHVAQNFNDNLEVSGTAIDGTTHDSAYGFELGGVFRNLYGFGEYGNRYIHAIDDPSAHQVAYSIYGGWLITGEKPGFSSRSGIWGTTHVNNPVTSGGAGAFELTARYDNYDFSDEPDGGIAHSWTVGLNWYVNDWARMMADYVHWTTNNGVGTYKGLDTGDSIGVRAQVAF